MDLEYIKKNYFSYSEAANSDFKKWFSCILQEAFNFVKNIESHHLHGELPQCEMLKIFRLQNIPQNSMDVEAVLKEALEKIIQNSVHLSQATYIGHMTQICPNFSLLIDFIISFLNQNLVKIETALSATYIEWQTLNWFHKLIYNESTTFYNHILDTAEHTLGNMCSGGTLANLTALVVARNNAFPEAQKIGLFGAYAKEKCSRAVIIVSARGHYSLKKAAAIMGIGEQNVITIPCILFTNQIDINALQNTLILLKEENAKVICIVGIAGSTETGSVDDLEKLAQIAQENNIWFHVDAAWAGALLLSKKYSSLLSGIKQADSVTLDGHKLLYLTISHSVILFKSKKSLNNIKQCANYIIREGSHDLGKTSIEGSRRFDSFKLWFTLKVFGRNGYELLINEAIEKAKLFYELIQQHPDFEVTSAQTTGILTYRFIPRKVKRWFLNTNHTSRLKNDEINMNLKLNEINAEIQEKQKRNGKSFVSRTKLESFFQGQDIVVLRALPFNPLTSESILADILIEQAKLGMNLFVKLHSKHIR